jgi:hypothetical protein
MLQRIQTIWLLLAALCAFLGLKFPFYVGTNKEGIPSYILKGTENIPLILVTTAVGVVAFITIFLYKNRKLQLRLCIAGILLEALVIFLYYSKLKDFMAGTYALTAVIQAGILLFLFLAARGISNDEKIIKESNRLR